MKIVRGSVFKVWKDLVQAVLDDDINEYIQKNGLNEKQQEYIEDKVWGLMTKHTAIEKLPEKQGRAFWLAMGKCTINYSDIANRLNTQLKNEGKKLKSDLIENDIKGYMSEVRKRVYKKVRGESSRWEWENYLKKYEK